MSHTPTRVDKLLIKPTAGARPAPPCHPDESLGKARPTRPVTRRVTSSSTTPGWQQPQTDQPAESHSHPVRVTTEGCACSSYLHARQSLRASGCSRGRQVERPQGVVSYRCGRSRPLSRGVWRKRQERERRAGQEARREARLLSLICRRIDGVAGHRQVYVPWPQDLDHHIPRRPRPEQLHLLELRFRRCYRCADDRGHSTPPWRQLRRRKSISRARSEHADRACGQGRARPSELIATFGAELAAVACATEVSSERPGRLDDGPEEHLRRNAYQTLASPQFRFHPNMKAPQKGLRVARSSPIALK